MRQSLLDKTIEFVSPKWALKRARYRAAIEAVRAYEGAARGRRTEGWRTQSTSANAETRSGLTLLRDRARDLVRNNSHATRAVSVLASNIVAHGIKTSIKNTELQEVWNAWAETKNCDAIGQLNIYGQQEIAAREIVESGEVFVRRIWSDDTEFPMQIQLLESDYLDSTKDGSTSGGGKVIQGVEFDARGRRVAYWMFDDHPGNGWYGGGNTLAASRRVDARDIIHIYSIWRAGQVRGVTWFAPVMLRTRDRDEYADAQAVRQKVAACFAGFIRDIEVPESSSDKYELKERIEPGAIEILPPGKDIVLATPPVLQGYGEYMTVTDREIAAGIGITYESLTGDYSKVNFTSGRMGRSEFHSLLDVWQWNMFIPGFCDGVFAWFLDAAALAGYKVDGIKVKHTPPRRTLVDPTREIPTIIKAVRGGVLTLFEAVQEMGYDPEEFFKEYAECNKLLDKLGISLDSDPRKMSSFGQLQPTAQPGGEDTASEEV